MSRVTAAAPPSPGPWRLRGDHVEDLHREAVAYVPVRSGPDEAECRANAHLLAGAWTVYREAGHAARALEGMAGALGELTVSAGDADLDPRWLEDQLRQLREWAALTAGRLRGACLRAEGGAG